MSAPRHLAPEDFASEKAIARNHARLIALGDVDHSGDMFAADLAAEAAASLAAWRANLERRELERAAAQAERARGTDLPLFA